MIKIELSNKTIVEVVDKLTWGMKEQITSSLMDGFKVSNIDKKEDMKFAVNSASLLEGKYQTIELCVKKIVDSEGKEIKYTREWMENLSPEDGDKLYEEINKVTSPEKK